MSVESTKELRLLTTGSSGGAGRPSRNCRTFIQEKIVGFTSSKTHPLWYAAVGREAKKGIVVEDLPANGT